MADIGTVGVLLKVQGRGHPSSKPQRPQLSGDRCSFSFEAQLMNLWGEVTFMERNARVLVEGSREQSAFLKVKLSISARYNQFG